MKKKALITVIFWLAILIPNVIIAQTKCEDANNWIEVRTTKGKMLLCNSQSYTVTVTNSSERPVKIYISVYDENGTRQRIHGGLYFKSVPPNGTITYKDEITCNHTVGETKYVCHFEQKNCFGYDYPR